MGKVEELNNEAMRLSDKEKGHLIHNLISSLSSTEKKSDIQKDIEERIESIKTGTHKGIDAKEVFKNIETKYAS